MADATDVDVEFKREPGEGISNISIYVNGQQLLFSNDVATLKLSRDVDHELNWRMAGNPGSTLTLKIKYGTKTATIVDQSKIPKNKSRLSDFTFFKLEP